MAGEGKYIFCITETKPAARIGETGIHTIAYRDLAAVVKDAPLSGPKPTRQDLMGHLQVIEQVMAGNTVIPVEFGTIAASEAEVREKLLASRYGQWRALLGRLAGKAELGLKVMWRELEVIFAEVVAENEKIRVLRDWIAARPQADTRLQTIEIGKMVADALEWKKREAGDKILKALTSLAVETRAGKLLGEKMILNAAFLVDKEREAEFDEKVSCLAQQPIGRYLFQYVGPAPPFNFVTETSVGR